MAEFNKAQWQRDNRAENRERERLRSRAQYHANIKKSREWAKRKSWKKKKIEIPDSAFPPHPTCEICGIKGEMHLDHNHATGKFRGWLCGPHNRMLGMAKDNPRILVNAARYLMDRPQ